MGFGLNGIWSTALISYLVAAACGECFYESFFTCPADQNDRILLRDYAQILIEKCNFTYVAETEDRQVVLLEKI